VEQAKGYLVSRHEITPDEAFQALRAQARRQRRTVHELAGAVMTGERLGDLEADPAEEAVPGHQGRQV
jgi:AmiR/NasT family two-component response regulator